MKKFIPGTIIETKHTFGTMRKKINSALEYYNRTGEAITYKDLLNEYGNIEKIPYSELIETIEWFEKRKQILERDNNRCTLCFKKGTNVSKQELDGSYQYLWDELKNGTNIRYYSNKQIWMHVHHKFYIKNKLQWDYRDEDLITYCNWCHFTYHENNKIQFFENINEKLVELFYTPCPRCFGSGWFPQYKHVENGICFECRGARFKQLLK